MYKPRPEPFRLPSVGQRNKHHIVIGDFNSHSTLWGYSTTNRDGEYVEQWADSNNMSFIHNAKLPKSFNSAIWKKGSQPAHTASPDMCDCKPGYCATKLFDFFLLEILQMYLITHYHQFGFKTKHYADMCIFTVKTLSSTTLDIPFKCTHVFLMRVRILIELTIGHYLQN